MMSKYLSVLVFLLLVSGCTTMPSNQPLLSREQQMRVAERAERQGQMAVALRIYQQLKQEADVKKADPGDDLLLALGRLYYHQNNLRMAKKSLSQIRSGSPQFYLAQIFSSRSALRSQRIQDAQRHLLHIAKEEKTPEYFMLQAVVWDMQGKHKQAQKYYLRLMNNDEFNFVAQENYARSLILSGHFSRSEQMLSELKDIAPQREEVVRLLALSRHYQGQYEAAVDTLSRIYGRSQARDWLNNFSAAAL